MPEWRLTSEMVFKTVQMQIPILISRSGFTASSSRARRNLTLVGRAKGKRFVALTGEKPHPVRRRPPPRPRRSRRLQRKASLEDDV